MTSTGELDRCTAAFFFGDVDVTCGSAVLVVVVTAMCPPEAKLFRCAKYPDGLRIVLTIFLPLVAVLTRGAGTFARFLVGENGVNVDGGLASTGNEAREFNACFFAGLGLASTSWSCECGADRFLEGEANFRGELMLAVVAFCVKLEGLAVLVMTPGWDFGVVWESMSRPCFVEEDAGGPARGLAADMKVLGFETPALT